MWEAIFGSEIDFLDSCLVEEDSLGESKSIFMEGGRESSAVFFLIPCFGVWRFTFFRVLFKEESVDPLDVDLVLI